MRFPAAVRDVIAQAGAMRNTTAEDGSMARARQRMVKTQLARRGIADQSVLRAMGEVPREHFVMPGDSAYAYDDTPLPIGGGQTISQPFMVATMLEAAVIGPDHRVLEVGTGSGYVAALLSRMAASVYTIERDATLCNVAQDRLRSDHNVHVRCGDGAAGWPEAAPFNAILVAAAAHAIPSALKDQLTLGGRLLVPIGDRFMQRLIRLTREDEDHYREDDLGAVMFVPLR